MVAYHEDSDGGTPATTRKVIALRNWGTGAEQTLAVTSAGGVDLSGDGRTLVFSTGDALVGSDTNATADIYVWTPSTGALRLISGH